jgi:4-hydroxy-2-oxoglutarate aldolase
MNGPLQGIIGPVVTPFQPANGEIDRTGFVNNLRAHFAAGLHGVVVTGSTGEAPLLDERERGQIVEFAREVVTGEQLLIAGTGAESTRACLRYTNLAAQRGADAVLVVAPHYYGSALMTTAALRAHYLEVADKSPVPVLLYNIPKYMHFALSPQLVAELARHENVVGIKDSSGDLELLAGYLKSQSDTFSVLTGNGSTFKAAMEKGAKGAVLAVSLFAPELAREVYSAFTMGGGGNSTRAERAQAHLTPLSGRIVGELGIAGIKAALEQVGLTGGPVRPPLLSIGQSELAQLIDLLRRAELPLAA